jgi:hypothetical protein
MARSWSLSVRWWSGGRVRVRRVSGVMVTGYEKAAMMAA